MEPLISSIKPLPSDPTRCSVRVGRRVVARLPRQTIQRLGIREGAAWTEALDERAAAEAGAEKVWREALRIAERRLIGAAELADRLRRKGRPPEAVEAAVCRLRETGLLDDEAYARALVDRERARKPVGRRLLIQKLLAKRLDRAIVERIVDEALRGAHPVAEARRLAEKRLRSPTLQRCEARARYRRLQGTLARRGFDAATIRHALDGLINADDAF